MGRSYAEQAVRGIGFRKAEPIRQQIHRVATVRGESEGDVRLPGMNRRPLLVEWDLTGSEDGGFGAVVYLASAPVRIVREIEPVFETDEQVADAVDRWLATVPDDYRLNAEFQAFKATARRFSGDENPERQAGQWWRALDT